jgi:RNA polymerase sigma factor (sigma-70 family)
MGLIAAEHNGTSHETEALYLEHGTAVARFCRSLLRDRGEAEDATQQVFLSAHWALLNGAAPREPLAWLLAVARNECYARFRERTTTPIPAAELPEGATADASVHVLRAGELASVWEEVRRMPPAQRDAFVLREIRGLSYEQLADELSLSPPSVRSLLLRARSRLRQRLADVAAGLGSAPWLQTLFRLVAGGDGASPVPAATKAAAVGLGALAIVGGGGLIAHHVSRTAAHGTPRQLTHSRVHGAAGLQAAVAGDDLLGRGHITRLGQHRSGESESGRSGSSGDSGEQTTSSGESSSGSGQDGSGETTATTSQATDSSDGISSSSGSSSGSSDGGVSDGSTSTSGSTSGSDGGSSTTATATTSSSGSSDGGLSDGSTSTSGSTSGSDGGGGTSSG